MRDGWKNVAISDVCTMIKRGQAPSYTESQSVTVLNQKCIRDGRINLEFSRQTDANLKPVNEWAYLNTTDTLVNSTGVGTLGRVAFVKILPRPTTVDSHVTIVRPDNKKIEPSFLGLSLNFREADIEGLAAGSSGQTELSREALGNLIITLPTLPEQKRIVDLISSVDSYIEALQQHLASAKRSRNAVLHELLTAGGDDWVETTLEAIADVVMGQSPDGKTYNQDGKGLPFMQGSAEFGEHNPVPEKWCSEPKKIAEPGDLLLSVRAPVGDTNFADQRIAVGRGLSIIRANKASLTEFIRLVIQINVSELIASSGSGMFASITGKNLKEFKVNLPPVSEQKRIVEIINTIDEVIAKTVLTTNQAKDLRSGLLSDLLSGEHEIPVSYDKAMGAA